MPAFKHNSPQTLIINYGQILYKTMLVPFKQIYHQHDKALINHVKGLYFLPFKTA